MDEVIGLHAALRSERPDGVIDLVPAARTVLVTFGPATSFARLVDEIGRREVQTKGADAAAGETVELAVTYDGPDLADVARLTGLTVDEVVRRHEAGDYVVAFAGFAPGFAYVVGGDPVLHVPRRDTPRTRVPAGSVALAGEFTGVYPREGPGGWQLIGRTDAILWDIDRDPPARLVAGTRVRFRGPAS